MKKVNYAAIDIGSNAVRLLIKSVNEEGSPEGLLRKVQLIRKKEKKTGIRVEIIDGQEEAHIVYDNHIEQLFASGQNYLYVDVGGGSTEINLICDSELKSSRSYNIGTVRMLSGMVKNEEKEQMRTDLQALAAEYAPIQIIFLEVAKQVNATGITVPTIGLSDGIIDSLYTKNMRMETDAK